MAEIFEKPRGDSSFKTPVGYTCYFKFDVAAAERENKETHRYMHIYVCMYIYIYVRAIGLHCGGHFLLAHDCLVFRIGPYSAQPCIIMYGDFPVANLHARISACIISRIFESKREPAERITKCARGGWAIVYRKLFLKLLPGERERIGNEWLAEVIILGYFLKRFSTVLWFFKFISLYRVTELLWIDNIQIKFVFWPRTGVGKGLYHVW